MSKKKPNLKKMAALFDEIQVNAGVQKKKGLHWYTKVLFFVDICAVLCFFMAYGPIDTFRDWLVTTALGTGKHKYFAYVLYSQNYVNEITSANSLIASGDQSDTGAITFVDYSNITVYSSEYDKQVLDTTSAVFDENGKPLYKMLEIDEGSYSGYVAVIYQPERLQLVISGSKYGNAVSQMCSANNAYVGVNGGGYDLTDDYVKYPTDNLIINSQIYYDTGKAGSIIGMNEDGVLMLYNGRAQEAIDAGMVWGLEFGPFLIVNGEPAHFTGNGGAGYQPRTAIGQRKDGVVLMIVIDGRGGNGSNGASWVNLIELFERYECYNAANLDGGGSSVMWENGKTINHPVSYDSTGERNVLDAIILK